MGAKENKVKTAIIKRFGGKWRVYNNPRGKAKYENKDGGIRVVEYGLAPGMGDLVAIIPRLIRPCDVGKIIGQFGYIETKRLGNQGGTSEEQDICFAVVKKFGGFAVVADCVEDVEKAYEEELNADSITGNGEKAPRAVRRGGGPQAAKASAPDLRRE